MPERLNKPSIEIILEAGTRAYALPELGHQDPLVGWRQIIPPTVEEANEMLNQLLESIEKQRGQIIGIINIDVAKTFSSGERGPSDSSEPKTFLIIKNRNSYSS